jgi:hypothetical protein
MCPVRTAFILCENPVYKKARKGTQRTLPAQSGIRIGSKIQVSGMKKQNWVRFAKKCEIHLSQVVSYHLSRIARRRSFLVHLLAAVSEREEATEHNFFQKQPHTQLHDAISLDLAEGLKGPARVRTL